MEALEKPKEKRTKSSGGSHGIKGNSAMVDPAAATHQHVRLRIKLPVSPSRNPVGSMKASKSTTSSKPTAASSHQDPATSELSDHKSSGTEPTSPASEYQNLSHTSLKELRRRYEAKFGTVTLSNNSDYLKRKLAGQCGPPRLARRAGVEHDVGAGKSPKRSPTFRRRKVEEVLKPDVVRGLDGEEDLELLLEADGEGDADDDTEPEYGAQDAGASTPLKKLRSGRKDGGANQWTNQADEIRRIVRKKRRNRAFPPQTLVWAKLEDRPWWPARVVNLEELPESLLEKKLVGWTCVQLYGLPTNDEQRWAWLRRENLASYKKFRKDFNEQKFPERFVDSNFQSALKEISEEARRRRTADNTVVGTRLFIDERNSSMELRTNSSSSDDNGSEAPTRLIKETYDTEKKHLKHRAEIVQGKLKQMRMKNVQGLQGEDLKSAKPLWGHKEDEDEGPPNFKKTKEDGGNMSRKRKRPVTDDPHKKEDSHFTSDDAEDVMAPDSPPKKAVSDSKFSRQSSGKKTNRSFSNDLVKTDKDASRKPKRTGEDGYYYDCEVCGIGGELLCCDLCPRVYHLDCLTPPLKRTPPGKWVCPTCRDRPGATRPAGQFGDSRQQTKFIKGSEDPSARVTQKIWRKEKPAGPVISSDDSVRRKREDSDAKRRRKRAKSKGEDGHKDGGQRKLNCGYCGVATSSLRSSGLCDKCHAGTRAGNVDDNPDISAPVEYVESTHSDRDRKKSRRCHTCGERGVVISCESCSRTYHKECLAPSSQRSSKTQGICSKCNAAADYKLEDKLPPDSLSNEVESILGCRVAASQDAPSSRHVTQVGKDGELKVVEEGDLSGSDANVSEGPGDAADMEWKVVKRVQSSPAEPMEIDSPSGADAVVITNRKSPNLMNEQKERFPEDTSGRATPTKEKTNTTRSLPTNGSIAAVEDHPFVIELGGHHVVKSPLANTDGNVLNIEIASGGLSNSAAEELTTAKTKETQSKSVTVPDGISPQEQGYSSKPGDCNSTDKVAQTVSKMEFLVKWVGRSHIHNEWIGEEKLISIAKRQYDEYISKNGTVPLITMNDRWLQPQRILSRRASKNGPAEVLVKWHSLPYDECTWEEEQQPAISKNSEHLQAFERFEAVSKQTNVISWPSAVQELTEQPEWLKVGGLLFSHQMEAFNWLRESWYRRRNVLLADEVGMGKTTSVCAFLASLYREFHRTTPCLVLVPLASMSRWQTELSAWAPSLNVIEYHGTAKARSVIREYEWYVKATEDEGKPTHIKFNVMLTTFEMLVVDSSQLRSVPWEVLIVDEGYGLRNSESKLFTLLSTLSIGHRVLLTSTPLENNPSWMYNLLNFLQPETFPSQDVFEKRFSSTQQFDEVKKVAASHMLRRLKKDVMPDTPPIAERVVFLEQTSVQAEFYREHLTKNYQLLRQGGGVGHTQALLNILMQLREVCNHPHLLGAQKEGSPKAMQDIRIKASAKMTLLHSMLHKLKKGGHRVVIFSQMTKVLDILGEYLSYEFGHQSFERIDGPAPVAERQKAISQFNQDQSRFVFLMSTRSCGLGINLPPADTVIIYDSDLNPRADIEAMSRVCPIGQYKNLMLYRLVTRTSVEERIFQLRKNQSMLERLFLSRSGSEKEVGDIMLWGTEKLFSGERSVNGRGTVDDSNALSDTSQRKEQGVVWDDAVVSQLLDRSEPTTTIVKVTDGEHGSDGFAFVKTWNWNEADGAEQVDTVEGALRDSPSHDSALRPCSTEEHHSKWEKLLRARWEKLQKKEEDSRVREKGLRKSVDRSSDLSKVGELYRDQTSEPHVKPLLERDRANDVESNVGGNNTQSSRLAHEGRAARSSAPNPLQPSQVVTSQPFPVDGDASKWKPHFSDGTSAIPQSSGLGDSQRMTALKNIINVEQSRDRNVSYPHRVYTVPGIPVSSLTGGEQLLAISKSLGSSSLSREQTEVDLSALRKQFAAEQGSKIGGGSSPAIRQLLPPALPGSRVFGSGGGGGLVHLRPRLPFEGVVGRSFNQTGASEPASRVFPPDVAVTGSRMHRPDSEERIFDTRRLDGELQGLAGTALPQPELLQRAYPKDGQNSALLSTAGLLGAGLKTESRDSSMSVSEILKRVANQKGGVMLPPPSSTDGGNASTDNQGFPNLSMSLGLGGLILPHHDEGLLLRARASHDSQQRANQNKMSSSLGGSHSAGGSGDATRIQNVHKHELVKKGLPFGEADTRFKQDWTEDELDSLWTGVRRNGVGNWTMMLQDRRLNFHKHRTAHDLAERWREEQLKLFGAPPGEAETKPARQDEGIHARYRDHSSASDELNAKKLRKESSSLDNPVDLSNSISQQGLGNGPLGEFDRKQVLESLRAVDLSYRRSSSNAEHHSKLHESSSALDLVNSVRSQVGGGVPNIEFDKWEGSSSRRRNELSKEARIQLQKAKVPSSFLANLSFSQDAQTSQEHQTLPLLPPNLGMQSSSGVFSQKASFPHHEQYLSTRGYHHDSPRSSLSSTFAELEKRRLKIGLGASKNNADEASQSLPHWLREAFKPDQPSPPKPATVSPMITAVAQATAFLYKDCVPFLPPFVHPGPMPTPPRRAVKKKRKPATVEPGAELNLLMESTTNFNSSFNSQPGSAPSTSAFPKRPVDFSALPSLDPPAPRPSPALEELMALKNLSASLPPFAPPLSEPVAAEQSSPAKSDRHHRHHHRHLSPFSGRKQSPLSSRKGEGGGAPKRKTVSPLGSSKLSEEGSPESSAPREVAQQLPSWLVPVVDSKLKSSTRQKASSTQRGGGGDGNSSSETESDPRIRGAAGMAGDGDASSDETVSDDRTQ